MPDPQPAAQPLHLQISGELPLCVLGWRFSEHEDVAPDLAAVYGPLPSQDAAERLIAALTQLIPDADSVMNFTVVPIFPVVSRSADPMLAPR